jgi:uncharacterized protein
MGVFHLVNETHPHPNPPLEGEGIDASDSTLDSSTYISSTRYLRTLAAKAFAFMCVLMCASVAFAQVPTIPLLDPPQQSNTTSAPTAPAPTTPPVVDDGIGATTKDGYAAIPALRTRVTDAASILGVSAKQELEQKLVAFEQATGGQLAVLIVKTAQPETIEQYALRVAEKWKIGTKGADKGAIIVLAMQERKIRIEVGYGWEGALPDITAKRIIRETMTPYFKQNQYAQGLDAAIDKIQLAVSVDNKAASNTVNEKGQWEQSHNATATDSTVETLLGLAPILLGVLLIGSFFLPSYPLGFFSGLGTFFFTNSWAAALIAGFVVWVLAAILKGIFGSFRKRPLGGRRVHRNSGWSSGPWISSGGDGGWSSGSSGGDSGGFSGGGGDFGGGGASGDW